MIKNKRTWILLRGLAREKGHWGPFLESFEQRFPGDVVLPIDLPGAGEFCDTSCPKNMSEVFQFVRGQVIQRAESAANFSLLAISMGGMVAMEWMKQKPQELETCVLINTSLKSLSPIYQRLRWQIWQRFLQIISIQNNRERERSIIELLMNNDSSRQQALPLWAKIATERPMSYGNFINQLMAAARFEGLDSKPDVPVLLLNSLGDRFTDPSCSEALHEKWGWPIHRHPWAGHDLPWDDAEWVLNHVWQWTESKDAKRHQS